MSRAGSVYTVAQINSYIHRMFSEDFLLARVYVKGEISNCKYHPSGHIYFTLKDEKAAISCVMFASDRKGLSFRLSDGLQVIVLGSVGVYEKGGTYQIYAKELRMDGLGVLYERFEALKQELGEMGMFDPAYKKPIPRYIRTLGVVTAPTGAAIRDIIQIAKRRSPGIRIILYPARVQGEGAADSIAAGIQALEQYGVDTMIIGRGGGSIEDLWAFNEEITARAVFSCRVPVISAVGHETDTVITDYVADLRAPTPSAAAELAVADIRQLLIRMGQLQEQMSTLVLRKISDVRGRAETLRMKLELQSPGKMIRTLSDRKTLTEKELERAMAEKILEKRDILDRLGEQSETAVKRKTEEYRHRLLILSERLAGLSPYEKLAAGYAFITDPGGNRIVRASMLSEGKRFTACFRDGNVLAEVEKVEITDTAGSRSFPERS